MGVFQGVFKAEGKGNPSHRDEDHSKDNGVFILSKKMFNGTLYKTKKWKSQPTKSRKNIDFNMESEVAYKNNKRINIS